MAYYRHLNADTYNDPDRTDIKEFDFTEDQVKAVEEFKDYYHIDEIVLVTNYREP